MSFDAAALADAVNARMKERGINQRQLAERSGVAVATLRQIQHAEPKTRRSAATLKAISLALGLTAGHLSNVANMSNHDVPTGHDAEDPASARFEAMQAQLTELADRVRRIEEALSLPHDR